MDNINPEHYKAHEMECIDEMVVAFGKEVVYDFCICNVWKYRYRAGHKDNVETEMQKADWYMAKAKELNEYL